MKTPKSHLLHGCDCRCIVTQEMFAAHVDGDQLISALEAEREFVMTPKMFMHTINRICLQQVSPHYILSKDGGVSSKEYIVLAFLHI